MVDPSLIDTVDCDVMIVGAGSSGCVLASRLVRQGLKVLLVEKGSADAGQLGKLVTRTAEWMPAACGGRLSEKFMTVPQSGLGNRRMCAFRGLGGGGSSNINAGLYLRGSKKDYEEYWPWELKDIETSFKSIEAELTLEEHKTSSTIGPSWDRMFEEIGFEHCHPADSSDAQGSDNGPTWTKEGIGGSPLMRTTTNGGERQSAWRAFVRPVITMPNLRIKDDATVSRVIIEGGRAVGIEVSEFLPMWKGRRRRVRQLRLAKEAAEIVLCCGVFRTPKLLMLSGVGPRGHLEDKGISVMADLPHVGANLCDHLLVPTMSISKVPMAEAEYSEHDIHGLAFFSFALPPPETSGSVADASCSADAVSAPAPPTSVVLGFMHNDGGGSTVGIPLMVRVLLTQPGFLVACMRECIAALAWILLRFTPLGRLLRRTRGTMVLLTTVKGRGTVRLASKDPAAPPLIDPAYLTHPEDRQAMCAALHAARRARMQTPTSKAVLGYDLAPGKMYNYCRDDESCLSFARNNCASFFHPVGTCRMGAEAGDSVVSADNLRVHGIAGLRVADASVAPRIPSTPTQAMAMMIGDRASAIVLKDRFAKDQVQERWREAASSSVN